MILCQMHAHSHYPKPEDDKADGGDCGQSWPPQIMFAPNLRRKRTYGPVIDFVVGFGFALGYPFLIGGSVSKELSSPCTAYLAFCAYFCSIIIGAVADIFFRSKFRGYLVGFWTGLATNILMAGLIMAAVH